MNCIFKKFLLALQLVQSSGVPAELSGEIEPAAAQQDKPKKAATPYLSWPIEAKTLDFLRKQGIRTIVVVGPHGQDEQEIMDGLTVNYLALPIMSQEILKITDDDFNQTIHQLQQHCEPGQEIALTSDPQHERTARLVSLAYNVIGKRVRASKAIATALRGISKPYSLEEYDHVIGYLDRKIAQSSNRSAIPSAPPPVQHRESRSSDKKEAQRPEITAQQRTLLKQLIRASLLGGSVAHMQETMKYLNTDSIAWIEDASRGDLERIAYEMQVEYDTLRLEVRKLLKVNRGFYNERD